MKLADILLQYRQEHNLSMREFSKLVVKEDELILYTTTKPPFCIIVNKNGIKKALPEGRVY